MTMPTVHVVGGGLAGCEAALQLARFGIGVTLHEMRPHRPTPAHRTGDLAEIVCSNSLKSRDLATASGLFKQELTQLDCQLLAVAGQTQVPAGAALAVDRAAFARRVTELVAATPAIRVVRDEVTQIAPTGDAYWLLATGPLTSTALQEELGRLTGRESLHFFDAIAPTVTLASLERTELYRAARYGRGSADYLNAPLDEAGYRAFQAALVSAERAETHEFDRSELFSGCQPIEEIAASGTQSLAFGPLRPVGLEDPRTGRRPYAVVQLRQENMAGTLYGLVGFQTRLRRAEQRRVFGMIPGLRSAEYVRYGQLHRNFYLDTPRTLACDFSLPAAPHVYVAGQITGVEGYVESIASGLLTAWHLAAKLHGLALPPLPQTTMLGALFAGFLFDMTVERLAPMNVNFGLLPAPDAPIRAKRERKLAQGRRALSDLARYLAQPALRRLLAARAHRC